MNAVYLLFLVTLVAGVSAGRALLASSTDKYGIVGAISLGNGSAAVTGFVSAGRAVDSSGAVTALVQIFDNRTVTDVNLYQTAEALSEAVLTVPAIFDTLSSAYLEAVLELFITNTTASIDVASVALAAVSFGQQPQIVQTIFAQAFTNGLANQAALATGTAESLSKGTCNGGTFLAAQYALAFGNVMAANSTAAGQALAAANNANLAGRSVAAATGIPMASAGCSLSALQTLATAQSALTAATGDATALATSMAMYFPSNSTLTCLASAQIQYSGQNAVAQAAALESYYTVMNQTVIGAGASGSAKVAGAGESLYEALEDGANTASGVSSLSGLAALAQITGCNYIYPVLIQCESYMSAAAFTAAVSQSAALSACYQQGMRAGTGLTPYAGVN